MNIKETEIKVLDHGSVRLVSFTQPIIADSKWTADLEVIRNARTSYDADMRTGEDEGKDEKLINYLMKNRHSTPFESVSLTFAVKAPIFVFRQWHRHRTWCLAGDSQIEFVRPSDGKPYKISIERLAASWNPKTAKRRRADQSPLSLEEHNRKRIGGMLMRCRGADGEVTTTRITDVWQSGMKKVFEVKAGGKTIRASGDHKFYSQGEWVEAKNLRGRKVTLLGQGGGESCAVKPFTKTELAREKWAEFADGYRVSTLGRVQSQWGQGARTKSHWRFKTLTVRPSGRQVVNIGNGPVQVSRLVANAFLPKPVPQKGKYVLHADDCALNNRLSNLRWGTLKENSEDSRRNGTRAIRSWVEFDVESVKAMGHEPVYDITVEHDEHCFVANNFLVHNCYNEISARYAELPEEFYVPDLAQITGQSTSNKQMRTGEQHPQASLVAMAIKNQNHEAFTVYKALTFEGVPRELARTVLPVATYSRMFATVNLHNLFAFCRLRDHDHAQHEIRVYAKAMLDLVEQIAPMSVAAFRRTL